MLAVVRYATGTLANDGRLEAAWGTLAEAFCGTDATSQVFWNVFGADLKNEPHGTHCALLLCTPAV